MAAKEKVVVTGGAGFIGSNLASALVKEGYEVHVVDSLIAGKREKVPPEAIFHQVDILDTAALGRIFKDAKFVFHEAAIPRVPYSIEHPAESNTANIDGTLSVLIAAKDAKVGRVIYAASSSAYGNQERMPLVETMPAAPIHPYGLQKYVGELYAKIFSDIYGLPTVSLRYFNVYGPGLDPNGPYALVIGKFLLQKKNGEPLTIVGDGTQTRDFTHVEDIVRANLLAAKSEKVGKGEVINIGSGHNVSVNALADLFGGERTMLPARAEAHDTLADSTRAKELLGWEPRVMFEDGIAELKREWEII